MFPSFHLKPGQLAEHAGHEITRKIGEPDHKPFS